MSQRLHRALFCLPLLLAGCGSVKMPEMNVGSLWPFVGEKAEERPRGPANATEYLCEGNRRFHVRIIENGEAAWVILREREFRLDKTGDGTRYARGANALEIKGAEATLTEGSATHTSCKAAGSQ